MTGSHKRAAALFDKPKSSEPSTFKNSLRRWQARWKAEKAAEGESAKESPSSGSKSAET